MLENVGALVQFWTKIARKYGLEIESHNRLKLIFKAATLGFKLLKGLVFFFNKTNLKFSVLFCENTIARVRRKKGRI